jgi:multidrug resistance protein, MATE family
MVPLGISSAASVRVGQAVGRRHPHDAAAAGWTALVLSGMFMGACGILLWSAPGWLIRRFIPNASVVASGAALLRLAALFQLFDGFQIVATGALRGAGDTATPMKVHLLGYWIVGLPLCYLLCFPLAWGVRGIWVGLTAALILIGAVLVWVWSRVAQKLHSKLV